VIELEYEMTYAETIAGPLPPTSGSPAGERLCWEVRTATLSGPRIEAELAMPGTDWMRVGSDGIRRPDLRVQMLTDDGETILLSYDIGVIRSNEAFLTALAQGTPTTFAEVYMRMVPRFEVATGRYDWLRESVFIARGRVAGSRAIEYEIYRVG
jgi:Protein of unknown function (DUF3237)